MRGIRVSQFGSPEVMRLEELSDLHPAPDQILVNVKAAGVNPADTYVRSGSYAIKPSLPYTPGFEGAGIIEEIGESVKGLDKGTKVHLCLLPSVTGTYAEQVLCTTDQVHRLPDDVSFPRGAAIDVAYLTAYRALFQRGHAQAGETVLIHGATGGVGIAAVQFCKAAGIRVIGTGGSERGRKLLLSEGAESVLDHQSPDHMDQALKLTNGHGVDVVLEMLANVNLGKDLKTLAKGGRVLIIGSRGKVEIDPRDTMSREAAVLGVLLFSMPQQDKVAAYTAIDTGLMNHSLRPIVGKAIPLKEAARSHQEVMQPGAYGKIVLVP